MLNTAVKDPRTRLLVRVAQAHKLERVVGVSGRSAVVENGATC